MNQLSCNITTHLSLSMFSGSTSCAQVELALLVVKFGISTNRLSSGCDIPYASSCGSSIAQVPEVAWMTSKLISEMISAEILTPFAEGFAKLYLKVEVAAASCIIKFFFAVF